MKAKMTTKSRIAKAAKVRPTEPNLPEAASVSEAVPVARDEFPVVGIGASAGGLEAFTKLFSVLASDSGMAFILIQHLDPTHESMMVALLGSHTSMKVLQATD